MNEELQSANEELETMNEELRHRTLELNDTNAFLEAILTTIGVAVAVLDRHQRVQIWNGQAYELWGLTAEEVEDQNLLALDFGLPVEQLKPQLSETLNGGEGHEELVVEAINRRGKEVRVPREGLATGNDREGRLSGVIMMMEEVVALSSSRVARVFASTSLLRARASATLTIRSRTRSRFSWCRSYDRLIISSSVASDPVARSGPSAGLGHTEGD